MRHEGPPATRPVPSRLRSWLRTWLGRTVLLAAATADWLDEEFARHPDDVHLAATLVASLAATGDGQRALRLARELVERFPTGAALWHHLAWHRAGYRVLAEQVLADLRRRAGGR